MPQSPDLLQALAEAALQTRPDEISCEEWVQQIGRYVEILAQDGEMPAALEVVARHTDICPQCSEELQALRDALAISAGPSDS